jgi:glycosyltransferase involved in cell wall biosynthesis
MSKVASLGYEIFVFDQHSGDETQSLLRAFLAKHPENTNINLSENNLGQSKSRTTMCNKGQGKFVLFLDGDIVPIRNSIIAMWEYLMNTKLPGIYYDVTGDTAVESKATKAENPLIPADVEAVPVVMFHYTMFRREWIIAHPLPQFAPFDGPGWGVEKEFPDWWEFIKVIEEPHREILSASWDGNSQMK